MEREHLRIWLLVTGIIILVGGLSFYFYGNYLIDEIEAYDVYDLPISEFLKSINPDLKFQYEKGQIAVAVGIIFIVVGIILCTAGILTPFVVSKIKDKDDKKEKDALAILNLRYAKGEISKKEFEKMKKDIKK